MTIKYFSAAFFAFFFITISNSQNVKYEWTKYLGEGAFNSARCIEKDSEGNIYIGGFFQDALNIESHSSIAQNESDGFLLKLTEDGDFIWLKQFYSENHTSITSLVIHNDEIFLLGGYHKQVQFDTTIISNNAKPEDVTNMFIASYSTSGDFRWAKNTAGIDHQGNTITLDNDSNLIITGMSLDVNVFDTDDEIHPLDSVWVYWEIEDPYWHYFQRKDGFLAKYDRSGNLIWVHRTGGKPNDVSVDENNNIVVTGNIGVLSYQDVDNDSIFYSGNLIEPTGTRSIFLAKHDTNGSLGWIDIAGGSSNNNSGIALETDNENNIYLTGYASGNHIEFQGIEYVDYGRAAFVTKYDPEGLIAWVKPIIGEKTDNNDRKNNSGKDIKLDDNNNLFVIGYFMDSLSFAGSTIVSENLADLMMLKMDTDGNELEVGINLDYNFNIVNEMVLGDNREIYLAGSIKPHSDPNKISIYKIDADDVTSINPIQINLTTTEIHPNPAVIGQLVKLKTTPHEDFQITIHSIDGQLVKVVSKNQDSFVLENSGMYVVRLRVKNQSVSSRIVVLD